MDADPDNADVATVSATLLVQGHIDPHASISATVRRAGASDRALAGLPRMVIAEAEDRAEDAHADFVVVRTLGQGGMGHVQLAVQRGLQRDVAIKRPHADGLDASLTDALVREARLMGKLEHPAIVPVHGLGVGDDGRAVLVMKRIDGVAWSALLADASHPGWGADASDRLGRNLELLRRVCDAVHFAHRRGVIHRDLKPDNVMVGEFGEVYVVDWGLAHELASPGSPELVGTPAYMAPEMLHGALHVDARTDVYLLGAMLHEALTGTARHPGPTLMAALASAAQSLPVAYGPGVPAELGALCNRATARDPDARPPSAQAFGEALAGYARHRESLDAMARLEVRRTELGVAIDRATQARATNDARKDALAIGARAALHALLAAWRQGLEVWSDNPVARAGLESTAALGLGFEIDARNLEAAELLFALLPSPAPAWSARLEELRAEVAEDTGAKAVLRTLRRDRDRGVSAWPRALALASTQFTLAAALLVVQAAVPHAAYRELFGAVALSFGLFGVLTWRLRRQLLVNKIGRRMQISAAMIMGVMLLLVLLGQRAGLALAAVLPMAYLAGACGFGMLRLWTERFAVRPTVVMVLAALVALALPAYPLVVLATLSACLGALSLWRGRAELHAGGAAA